MLIGRVTEVATGRSSAELRFDLARYGWTRASGLAGVNGGSAGSWGGTSYATASFDDVAVYRALASNLEAPTGLAVTEVGSNQVTLTWADNSDNEDGFRIERSTDGVTFTRVAATGPDTTRFVATGLSSRTTYYFRVRAYNAGGDSAPTSSVEVTTPEISYQAVFSDDFNDNAINAARLDLRQRHLVRGGRRAEADQHGLRRREEGPGPLQRRGHAGSPPWSASTPGRGASTPAPG